MTSEIDDPSVETDSCDSLERVSYGPVPTDSFEGQRSSLPFATQITR